MTTQVDALLALLRRGIHLVLSDVDCVWSADMLPFLKPLALTSRLLTGVASYFLRSADPLPFVLGQRHGYEALGKADVLMMSDCMQPENDFDGHGCFFDGVDKNTGIFAVRAPAIMNHES